MYIRSGFVNNTFRLSHTKMYLSRTGLSLYKIERIMGKSPISHLCFLFIIYLGPRRKRGYNPTALLARQSDILTAPWFRSRIVR